MRILLVFVLAVTALGGCIGSDADADSVAISPVAAQYDVAGNVLSPNFRPLQGAVITIANPAEMLEDGTTSDELIEIVANTEVDGNFTLVSFAGSYTVRAELQGYQPQSKQVTIPLPAGEGLVFQLEPANSVVPFLDSFDFDGSIQCAAEYLIMSPSCDTLLTYLSPSAAVFETRSEFDLTTPQGWQTVVLDVEFDGSNHPGIAGLRASGYASDGEAEVLTYERIRQQWAPGSFSIRIDAGVDYGDNVPAPSSDGGDGIQFKFFPQGNGDDLLCVPDEAPATDYRLAPGTCFLGLGLAADLTFTATATVFVHEAAPDGWTTFAGS
jgi:hypothetical protein